MITTLEGAVFLPSRRAAILSAGKFSAASSVGRPRFEHTRRVPLDDVVDGGNVAHVAQAVHLVGGLEDHGAGSHSAGLPVHRSLHGALPDDDEFLVRVLVRGMGRLAGGQGGDVKLELIEGGG